MHFDYRGITSSRSRPIPASMLELATNIITDWMPGTPNSLTRGFVDLLAMIIEPVRINGNNHWVLRQTVNQFEKQWKQVTSWILGVAFCKKVVELEGYPWIAPVSAFTSHQRRSTMQVPFWSPNIPITTSRIRHPIPRLTNLMPDYVLARSALRRSPFDISFAESKGCQNCLENLNTPPTAWINQARNAQFLFHNIPITATQNLIAATRVNPKAKKPKTRRIYVRCWNSKNQSRETTSEIFRDIVLMHYFGVCERIGMKSNAKLLALQSLQDIDRYSIYQREKYYKHFEENREALYHQAKDEIQFYATNKLMGIEIAIAPNRSDFQVGDRLMRVGLSSYGMNIVRWLQEDGEVFKFKSIIDNFQKEIEPLQSKLNEDESIFIRSDGVTSELIK